jgi:rare lipoprotein A
MDCVQTPTVPTTRKPNGSPAIPHAVPASDALRLMSRVKSVFVLASATAVLAGCAQQPSPSARGRSKEFFSSSVYGAASPRVVADGEAVPRGGGKYLVGHPYTIAGRRYVPSEQPRSTQIGMASYYGSAFHGRRTANGEVYDMSSISAAHPTMPLPSYVRVTNMNNGRSIIVRVNDRGPYHAGRVMDVSQRVAEALDFRRMGTAQVKVDYLGRAGLEGSDDRMLMASLRTDGRPAELPGSPGFSIGTMFASNEPEAAPPPAPVMARPAPQRLALVSEAESEAPPVVAATRTVQALAHAPLPPVRPFDLGTMPGADVQIGAPRAIPVASRETFATVAERQPAPIARSLALMPPPRRPAFVDSDLPPRR